MEENILQGVWPEWQIVRKIGKGSFGVVYEAVRRDHQIESRTAVKVISIPQDESEIESLRSEGLSADGTMTYLRGIVNDFVREIQLMESLKGVQNIVSVEDYKVVEKINRPGWDIYIRMELLTPFNTYIQTKHMNEREVIKLGCDICTALELCAKRNVIHRDIKPENIFVNSFGDFKLGDFGIARKLENVTGGLSQKGTYNYMAPEVERGRQYDETVDIYSLGMVLYRLMNRNRLPFLNTEQQLMNPNERMAALRRRMSGEPLPPPCDASPALAQIILCACDFDPKKRFASATAMKNALLNAAGYKGAAVGGGEQARRESQIQYGNRQIQEAGQGDAYRKKNPGTEQEETEKSKRAGKKKKSKIPMILASVLAVAVVGAAGIFTAVKFAGKNVSESVVAEREDDTGQDLSETADESKSDESLKVSEQTAAEEKSPAVMKLSDMTPVNASDGFTDAESTMDTLGNSYNGGNTLELHTYGSSAWGEYGYAEDRVTFAEYKIQNQYESMTGTAAVSDMTSDEKVGARLEFLGDDEILAYYDVERKTEPIKFKLDLSGVDVLKINLVYRSVDGTGDVYVLLADAELMEAAELTENSAAEDNREMEQEVIDLTDMKMTNGNDRITVIDDHTRNDVFGNIYSPANLLELETYGSSSWGNHGYAEDRAAFAEYHLGGEYSRLTGTIAVSDKMIDDVGAKLVILGDDTELVQYNITKKTEPVTVDLELTGISWLRIELRFYSDDGTGDVFVLLSDFELHR